MFQHILVPIDGSELTRAVVKRACSFARETGARLTFYYAKSSSLPYGMSTEGMFDFAAASEAYRAAMDKQAASLLHSVEQAAAGEGVSFDLVSTECDAPYEGIIAEAQRGGCDLIFMASHGHHGLRAFLLGSETQKVLTHCTIPVLVYR